MNWQPILGLSGLAMVVFGAAFMVPTLLVNLSRRYGSDDLVIKPRVWKYQKADESLLESARLRREVAESYRKQCARISSGGR